MRTGRTSRLLAVLLAAAVRGPAAAHRHHRTSPRSTTLVGFYDQRSGVWPTTGWWNSANALNALTNYMIVSGDHRYVWVVENTFTKKRNAALGNFINDFTDDTGWWALAWISAYDLTGDTQYLQTAQRDVDFMWSNHDDTCGGGLWWTVNRGTRTPSPTSCSSRPRRNSAQRLGDAGRVYLDRGGLGLELVRGLRG